MKQHNINVSLVVDMEGQHDYNLVTNMLIALLQTVGLNEPCGTGCIWRHNVVHSLIQVVVKDNVYRKKH